MRQAVALTVVAAAVVLIGGCGNEQNDEAPAACLAGNQAYLRSLESAPAPVRLAGTTPISDCLVAEQDAGRSEEHRNSVRLEQVPDPPLCDRHWDAFLHQETVAIGWCIDCAAYGALNTPSPCGHAFESFSS